jgi:hypothetical protein
VQIDWIRWGIIPGPKLNHGRAHGTEFRCHVDNINPQIMALNAMQLGRNLFTGMILIDIDNPLNFSVAFFDFSGDSQQYLADMIPHLCTGEAVLMGDNLLGILFPDRQNLISVGSDKLR